MPFTTGIITNTRAVEVAASNVAVSVRNLNSTSATIIVEIYVVPFSTLALTPLHVTGYVVPAFTADIREFFIAGNVAYEVQVSNLSPLAEVALYCCKSHRTTKEGINRCRSSIFTSKPFHTVINNAFPCASPTKTSFIREVMACRR